ncbi:D-dopachrome decarboxylase [Strongylocentrotus purpuratus]|uniref:D-dopachrome decarboxylase n=1 Tax=Strongylocentrotus purpuratus TaxID=7668 RepID=A0A7M7PNK2_STRPU|nr:D-dopachrome decarboxylase [Strongylocentrotus purpuratus]
MPIIEFVTNVPVEQFPEGFVARAATKVSEVLGKPLPAISISLRHEAMFRMGSDAPCLMIFAASVDNFLDQEDNRKYSKELIDFAAAEFNVQIERINLIMQTLSRWQIGLPNGVLLGDRMKQAK